MNKSTNAAVSELARNLPDIAPLCIAYLQTCEEDIKAMETRIRETKRRMLTYLTEGGWSTAELRKAGITKGSIQ